MKTQLKVLLIGFVFSSVLGFLSSTYLNRYISETMHIGTADMMVFSSNITAVYWIGLLLLLGTCYFMGKKIETKKEFGSCLLPFFIGNMVGYILGSMIILVLLSTVLFSVVLGFQVFFVLVNSFVPLSLFVGISGLAVGHGFSKSSTTVVAET